MTAKKVGRARVQELSREREAALQLWKSGMLAGLGRPWTAAEEVLAETIASLFIRARKARDLGQDDIAFLREAAELMRDSVFRDPRDQSPQAPRA